MTDIDIHHLGAAYALDALDERERTEFEAHYPSCEVCRADVSDFRATVTHLAEASATAPPSGLKARVMADIVQTRQLSPLLPTAVIDLAERRRRRQRWMGGGMAVAAALIAIVATTVVVGDDGQPAYATKLETVLGQDDAQFVTLQNTGVNGADGSVKVAWSDEIDAAVLLADDLPAAPSGKAYELWLIDADGPVPMNVLDDASDGSVRKALDIDAQPQAWGVTIEPQGGSPAPTGEILYLADV
jgi:anti-sigma-K factor RskA